MSILEIHSSPGEFLATFKVLPFLSVFLSTIQPGVGGASSVDVSLVSHSLGFNLCPYTTLSWTSTNALCGT
ncbi:hypothetical protein H5410_026759 [Solanum commersonii]|uniref:Uncharacterized protein n=1 Tax=Solanum commersonii TaxID=4109 RepID=A0A9J5YX21_SOLCO|nr:hypothetical protein H5410_026759 [Solanum commersonii]